MKNRIKEIRIEKKITQQQLADKLDISRQAVSKLEKSDSVTTSTLEKIAVALKCSIVDLIDKSDFESAPPADRRKIVYAVADEEIAKGNRAYDIASAAGYMWVLPEQLDGFIHLVDKRTNIEYAVPDEAFTAAVDSSGDFIDFNFNKMMESAKVINHDK